LNDLVTVIPVRGGSKGILRKNLQLVNKKSLVERAVLSALKVPNNRVIVSSDDNEILESIKRSEKNSKDNSTSEDVLLEVLSAIQFSLGIVTLLQATNPFTDVNAWIESIKYLEINDNIDSIFSAVDKNLYVWGEKNKWTPIGHNKNIRIPRQLNDRTVVETGSYYLFKTKKFLVEKTRFCGNTEPYINNIWSSFDIDTIEDLIFCQKVGKIYDDLNI
jgi:N-acylneuraminate cytidylyltransferase